VYAEARAAAREGRTNLKSISASDYDKYIRLQQARRAVSRGLKLAYNYSLGWVLPNFDLKTVDEDVVVPLNAAKLMDDLLAVHGHEALVDGCVRACVHVRACMRVCACVCLRGVSRCRVCAHACARCVDA
jgi:hypothetical protein